MSLRPTATSLAGLALALLPSCVPDKPGPVDPEPPSTDRALDAPPRAEPPDDAPPVPREPPRLLTDPGSGIELVWSGAAADATVAGAELVVLEPDGQHLEAIDWRDGEARWRIELPTSGSAVLHSLGDRVLVHDRDRAVVVEAARGRVLGRHEAPAAHRHGVERRRGACAWTSPCGIQAFDCSNGALRGDYLPSAELHLYGISDDPSEHSTSCSPAPKTLGLAGSTIVQLAAVPRTDESGRPAGTVPGLMGLDATGQPRWQRPLPGDLAPAGMSDDGTCWILDEDVPRLEVLDCETGASRWERPLGPGRLRAHAVDRSVVVARHHGGRWRLSAYATADGAPTWSVRLAKRQHPVLPGSPLPEAHSTGKRRVYAVVDPPRGTVVGTVVAGRDEELWRDPAGGFVLTGLQLRELDPEGRLTRQRPYPGPRVRTVLAGHVLTHDGNTIEIYDRDQLRERARIEGRMHIEPAVLPDDRLLLRRAGEDGVALVLGLEEPGRR